MAGGGGLRKKNREGGKARVLGTGGRGALTEDCVAAELSLLVASNSSLIKTLNPPHFQAPVLYN